MNYDAWKTADGDDPGRATHSKTRTMTLTCRDCQWTITARPIVAHSSAVRHAEETGHGVSYRGVVQEYARR